MKILQLTILLLTASAGYSHPNRNNNPLGDFEVTDWLSNQTEGLFDGDNNPFGDFEAMDWLSLLGFQPKDRLAITSNQTGDWFDGENNPIGDFEAMDWLSLFGFQPKDRLAITSNPTTYWTLMSDIQMGDPATITISKEQAGSMAESFTEDVVNENKASIDSSLDVSGVISLFDIKSSTQVHYATMTKTTTKIARSETSSFKSKTAGTWTISGGQFLMTAAAMEMYVFEDKDGNRKRMILPTGTAATLPFTPEKLKNMVLDDSFDRVNQLMPGQTIECHSLDEIEEQIAASNKLAQIPNRAFPDESKYYIIRNIEWPEHIIKQWGSGDENVGCYNNKKFDDKAQWRFEKYGAGYNIINKFYKGRMAMFTADWFGDGWGTYHGKRYPSQEWMVTDLGNGKVKITNVADGAKLADWGEDSRDCGGYDGGYSADQVWELLEVD